MPGNSRGRHALLRQRRGLVIQRRDVARHLEPRDLLRQPRQLLAQNSAFASQALEFDFDIGLGQLSGKFHFRHWRRGLGLYRRGRGSALPAEKVSLVLRRCVLTALATDTKQPHDRQDQIDAEHRRDHQDPIAPADRARQLEIHHAQRSRA